MIFGFDGVLSLLNRHTVRQILHGGPKRRLRNATVSQCADALGLTVSELRTLPIERLPNYQQLVHTEWLRQMLASERPEAAPAGHWPPDRSRTA